MRLVKGPQCLALRMNQRQLRGELPKYCYCGRLIIDKDAALPVSKDLASQNNLLAGVGSKTPATTAFSAPCLTTSEEAFSPIRRARASTRMDFPAPVSPVNRFRPGPKAAMA